MKTFLFSLLLGALIGPVAVAQTHEDPTWHIGISGGAGTMMDVHLELGFTSETGWMYEFHLLHLSGQADGVPPDYSGGVDMYVFESASTPRLLMTGGGMTVGKYSVLSKAARGVLQGGVLIGGYESPENYTRVGSGGWFNFGPNYDYDVSTGTWVGLYLHPEVFFVGRSLGMKIGSNVVLSNYRSSIGLEIGFLMGNLGGGHR